MLFRSVYLDIVRAFREGANVVAVVQVVVVHVAVTPVENPAVAVATTDTPEDTHSRSEIAVPLCFQGMSAGSLTQTVNARRAVALSGSGLSGRCILPSRHLLLDRHDKAGHLPQIVLRKNPLVERDAKQRLDGLEANEVFRQPPLALPDVPVGVGDVAYEIEGVIEEFASDAVLLEPREIPHKIGRASCRERV